jgi:hypothetical protein
MTCKSTPQQREQFVDSLIDNNLLEMAIDWIAEEFVPEQVFDTKVLENWAFDNGFKRFE